MEMINLMHTEWSKGWGGQEIRILGESIALSEKGLNVFIACQPDSLLFKRCLESGIKCLPIKLNKGLNLIALFRIVSFIVRNKINIIHTHSSVDSRVGGIAAKICRIPVVRSRHISEPVKKRFFTWFQYMVIADAVITSGSYIRKMLITNNKMKPSRIISIPAGVDANLYLKKQTSQEPNIIDELNLHGKFVIGMVSVLRSWKGHNYAIKAVNKLIQTSTSFHLLIVGDGPKRKEIETLIKKLNINKHVTLVGHVDNPIPYYRAMNIVLLPSYAGEATSQTLPQAMILGVPVITTGIGGLPEVVEHEKTGLVVEPRDFQQIHDAIFRMYSDNRLYRKFSLAGKEKVLKKFTYEKMVEDTYSVYKNLLKDIQ